MLERLSFFWGLFLFSASLLYASGQPENQDKPEDLRIALTDSAGETVRLPDYPGRVISLGPNLTETIFALGKSSLLIGRTDFCDYPPPAQAVPSVGSLQEPSIETIISLEPDLVLASTHVSPETMEVLKEVGIPVALLYGPEDFSGLQDVVRGCGLLLNAQGEAAALMEDIDARKDAVLKEAAQHRSRPTVYYALGFGDGGDWTAGAGTFIDSMIRMAGGENIARQEGWSFSKERLVEEDPEIIILGRGNKDAFLSLPIYRNLSASLSGRVHEIDENLLVRQGPRLIDGLEALAGIIEGSLEQ